MMALVYNMLPIATTNHSFHQINFYDYKNLIFPSVVIVIINMID